MVRMSGRWQLSHSEIHGLFAMRDELERYFQRRVGPDDSEDLVYRTLHDAAYAWKRKCSLHHFVFVIARRRVVDHWRRRRGHDDLQAPAPDAIDSSPGPHTWAQAKVVVCSALAKMPAPYREVFELWQAGRDNMQIANELGLNYNTVRSRLSRAMALLKAEHRARVVEAD